MGWDSSYRGFGAASQRLWTGESYFGWFALHVATHNVQGGDKCGRLLLRCERPGDIMEAEWRWHVSLLCQHPPAPVWILTSHPARRNWGDIMHLHTPGIYANVSRRHCSRWAREHFLNVCLQATAKLAFRLRFEPLITGALCLFYLFFTSPTIILPNV